MVKTPYSGGTSTVPATGLSAFVAAEHSARTAPNAFAQGTTVPAARTWTVSALAQVALAGARVIDLPGPSPRGAPV